MRFFGKPGRALALGAGLVLLLAPRAALAHEKWFTDPSQHPIQWGLFFSWHVLLTAVAAAAAVGGLLLLQRRVGDPLWPNPPWLRPITPSAQAIVGIQTAISLIFMASQGWLLAPTLPLPQGIAGIALALLVWGISLSFVTGWFTRVGAALLIAIVVLASVFYSPIDALEQMLFAGIGVYFLVLGRGLFPETTQVARGWEDFWKRYRGYALPALRIGTGLSIFVLAFTEKLLNPELGIAFLREYPHFNFMQLLGFGFFSDEYFIYAAGITEATIGLLLMVGVLPRVVILVMWVPFNITVPFLPPVELLGHLPILAVMYAVFLQGTGPVLAPRPSEMPEAEAAIAA